MSESRALPGAIEASLLLHERGQLEEVRETWHNLSVQSGGDTGQLAFRALELIDEDPELDTPALREHLLRALPTDEDEDEDDADAAWEALADDAFDDFLDDLLPDDEDDEDDDEDDEENNDHEATPPALEAPLLQGSANNPSSATPSGSTMMGLPPTADDEAPTGPRLHSESPSELRVLAPSGSTQLGRQEEKKLEPVDAVASARPPWTLGDATPTPAPRDVGSTPPKKKKGIRTRWSNLATIEAEAVVDPAFSDHDEAIVHDERPPTLDAVPITEDDPWAQDRPLTIQVEPLYDDEGLDPSFSSSPRPITLHAEPVNVDELPDSPLDDDPWADVAAALNKEETQREKLLARRNINRPTDVHPSPADPTPAQPQPKVGRSRPHRGFKESQATPARGTPPAPPPSSSAVDATILEESKHLLQEGDIVGAFILVEQLLKESPENYEAIYLANTLRERLLNSAVEILSPLDRSPTLCIPPAEIYSLQGLDHRAGYLLSQIDGMTPLDFLLDLGAMPRPEAALLLLTLEHREIIAF